VYARKPELDELGVALSCTVKEDLEGEIEAFREGYWPDAPIYLDETLAFYDAIAGGKRTQSALSGFLLRMANPFGQLQKNFKRAQGVDGNLKGEGFVHGGVYVVKKNAAADETPVFAHHETEIGDHPPTDDLVKACKDAAASSS